jgi:hypothetical protein
MYTVHRCGVEGRRECQRRWHDIFKRNKRIEGKEEHYEKEKDEDSFLKNPSHTWRGLREEAIF